jgi:hypothetical protein
MSIFTVSNTGVLTLAEALARAQAWRSEYFATALGEEITLPEGLEVTEIVLPEIPPPCWDEREIDADKAVAAVRAMCG